MTDTHTPGPWTASDERRGIFEIIHDGDLLAQVWRVRHAGDGDLPAEANARLIAAAPELLEACREALALISEFELEALDGRDEVPDLLRAAIAKAEGR
jgi:hypothetical protein